MIQQRTPGVYVEELSKFPPSVAGVATAIPVFIGFTAQQTKNKCEKITSLLDYSTKFGEACPLIIENNQLHGHEFVMYDSLRMFYDNGGSVCYVMSVGTYTEKDNTLEIHIGNETKNWSEITPEHYKVHFETLKKIDEITLMCFPDAAMLLNEEHLSTLQADALAHCEEMKDRFAILEPRYNPSDSLDDTLKKFRGGTIGDKTYTGIGSNHLKYGAAYYPYLKTSYSKDIPFETVITYMKGKGLLESNAYEDLLNKGEKIENFGMIQNKFRAAYNSKLEAEKENIFQYIAEHFAEEQNVLKVIYKTDNSDNDNLILIKDDNGAYIRKELTEDVLEEIEDLQLEKLLFNNYHRLKIYLKLISELELDEKNKVHAKNDTNLYDTNQLICEIQAAVDEEEQRNKEDFDASQKLKIQASISKIDKYQDALAELQDLASIITPCGAVAGIYCATDNNKGVWQAPANISIAAAADVTEMISDKEQENMNMDAESGKSVNAIRFFSGKGILIWGARTLAGNDNEWKYISVRRLFNYIEESVQKSTAWAVFQPNDANTWTKIQCQIENFLTGLWRNGALAGSTAEQAFYVKVGLNVTMTADDITNGNLIIEIGLAAVRPAEFIILQFSHKVQEA